MKYKTIENIISIIHSISHENTRRTRTLSALGHLQRLIDGCADESRGIAETPLCNIYYLAAKLKRSYLDFPTLEMKTEQYKIIKAMQAEVQHGQ